MRLIKLFHGKKSLTTQERFSTNVYGSWKLATQRLRFHQMLIFGFRHERMSRQMPRTFSWAITTRRLYCWAVKRLGRTDVLYTAISSCTMILKVISYPRIDFPRRQANKSFKRTRTSRAA